MLAGLDPATEEAMGTANPGPDPGWGDYGQATVVEGIQLIAGGIENVLQRLQLQISPHRFREAMSGQTGSTRVRGCCCCDCAARYLLKLGSFLI